MKDLDIPPRMAYGMRIREIAEQLVDSGHAHVDVDHLKKAVPARDLLKLVGLQIEMAPSLQKVDYLSEGDDSGLVATMLASYLKSLGGWSEKAISLSLLEAMSNNAAEFALPIIAEDINQRLPQLVHDFARCAEESMQIYSHTGDAA